MQLNKKNDVNITMKNKYYKAQSTAEHRNINAWEMDRKAAKVQRTKYLIM